MSEHAQRGVEKMTAGAWFNHAVVMLGAEIILWFSKSISGAK